MRTVSTLQSDLRKAPHPAADATQTVTHGRCCLQECPQKLLGHCCWAGDTQQSPRNTSFSQKLRISWCQHSTTCSANYPEPLPALLPHHLLRRSGAPPRQDQDRSTRPRPLAELFPASPWTRKPQMTPALLLCLRGSIWLITAS